jgi:hypothetical protein
MRGWLGLGHPLKQRSQAGEGVQDVIGRATGSAVGAGQIPTGLGRAGTADAGSGRDRVAVDAAGLVLLRGFDHACVLRLVGGKWNLPALTAWGAAANTPLAALDFASAPAVNIHVPTALLAAFV